MIQFLRSTLFPNNIYNVLAVQKKKSNHDKLIKRIELLEEENKKSAVAIKEITEYLSQMTIIVTSLAADFVELSEVLKANSEKDDIMSKYLKSDDDGYIH